jgi:hypothetical protein
MAKFPLGQVYIAPEAAHKLTALGRTVEEFLVRHQAADWGDNAKIQRTSTAALTRRSRAQPLLSFYQLGAQRGLVIATNPSRTHTAVSWRKVPAAPSEKSVSIPSPHLLPLRKSFLPAPRLPWRSGAPRGFSRGEGGP